MTIEELASAVDTNIGNIRRIEEGKYNMTFDILQKIAEVFNTNVDFK